MIIEPRELKRRYLQRLKGVRDNKIYIGPQAVGFDITHACNLACRYCWSHGPETPHHFQKVGNFSWKRFLDVVRDCVELNVDEILFAGFGEPTQSPLFRDMMRYAEQQPLFIKLYTNGTFPADYCSDVLRGDYVNIHLSAVDREQYHNLHGQDLFDHVVSNIKRLVASRQAAKPDFRIVISYIINAVNVNQKQEMQELASRLGVDAVYFEKVAHASSREIVLPGSPGEREERPLLPSCVDSWFHMVAMPDGNLTICPWVYHLHRREVDQGPLKGGVLKRGALKDAWSSGHMMNMRLLGKHGYFAKRFQACHDCLYYNKNARRLKDLAGTRI